MYRKDFQELAKLRLKESEVLLRQNLVEGAYYLAGYSVECALKACIAKNTRRHAFPDKPDVVRHIYSHDLRKLLELAKLIETLNDQTRSDLAFDRNWNVVQEWSEQSRYEKRAASEARDLVEAISDRQHGVMAWIRLHW